MGTCSVVNLHTAIKAFTTFPLSGNKWVLCLHVKFTDSHMALTVNNGFRYNGSPSMESTIVIIGHLPDLSYDTP